MYRRYRCLKEKIVFGHDIKLEGISINEDHIWVYPGEIIHISNKKVRGDRYHVFVYGDENNSKRDMTLSAVYFFDEEPSAWERVIGLNNFDIGVKL